MPVLPNHGMNIHAVREMPLILASWLGKLSLPLPPLVQVLAPSLVS